MPSYVTAYLNNICNTNAQTKISHPTNWNIDHWLHISRPGYTILQRVQRNISDHLPQMLFSNHCHLEAPDGKKDEEKSASRSGEEICISKVIRWWSNPQKKSRWYKLYKDLGKIVVCPEDLPWILMFFVTFFFVKLYQYWNPESGDTRTTNSLPTEKKLNVKQTNVKIGELWIIIHIHCYEGLPSTSPN